MSARTAVLTTRGAMSVPRCVAAAVIVTAAAILTPAVGAADTWRPLLDEALDASGITSGVERDRLTASFAQAVDHAKAALPPRGSEWRRARRLHAELHRTWLRRYRSDADGFAGLLERGDYNCVSSTLFEGFVASALGFDVRVVAGPRHVFLRLLLADGREVDVETTTPRGFDVRGDPERLQSFLLAYKLATPQDIASGGLGAILDQYQGIETPVELDRALAFLWHNVAERRLERGDAFGASQAFRRVAALHPDLAHRSEALQLGFAKAFRLEYEAGRFDAAFAVARLEIEALPDRTSARDRLLGAAIQRIEAEADAGDSAAAETVLDEVARIAPDLERRIERHGCPPIVAAAVRLGQWDRAHRLAERYAAAEPDPVEGARLAGWVDLRHRAAFEPAARLEGGKSHLYGSFGPVKLQ